MFLVFSTDVLGRSLGKKAITVSSPSCFSRAAATGPDWIAEATAGTASKGSIDPEWGRPRLELDELDLRRGDDQSVHVHQDRAVIPEWRRSDATFDLHSHPLQHPLGVAEHQRRRRRLWQV